MTASFTKRFFANNSDSDFVYNCQLSRIVTYMYVNTNLVFVVCMFVDTRAIYFFFCQNVVYIFLLYMYTGKNISAIVNYRNASVRGRRDCCYFFSCNFKCTLMWKKRNWYWSVWSVRCLPHVLTKTVSDEISKKKYQFHHQMYALNRQSFLYCVYLVRGI